MIWVIPINKAAYVFGTMSIANGNYDIMAAVMVGGMVPPIGIALATTFFKNRFSKSERQSGITKLCYGLGIHHRGCNSVCGSRSAARNTGNSSRCG